ncbi:MAG: hypothetical protein JW953_19970 [Anaerolineae bacterium]|nr:hypothetical protein [Anaerolineae bacterium]
MSTSSWGRRLLVMAVFIFLLLAMWTLSSYLWDQYRVVRDVQNFYWMARAQDPTLFATDYLYISNEVMFQIDVWGFHLLLYPLSLGYGLFFYLASAFIDYVWLTKLSILVLAPICLIYLFKLGRWLENNLTGFSLGLLFIFFILASPQSISIFTGLQRAFALPLLIVFLYYLTRQQYLGAALLLLMGALIYLPCFPLMVITYGLSLVKIEHPFKLSFINRSGLVPFIVVLLLAAAIVALALAVPLGWLSPSTAAVSTSEIQAQPSLSQNPLHQSGGSVPLFIGFPFLGRAGIFDTGADVTNFLVLLILSFLIYKVVGRSSLRRAPGTVWHLLAAGIIMYLLSLFFVFALSSNALYWPSRYTRSALFVTPLFFVGLNWVDFIRYLPDWLAKNVRLIIFFIFTLGLALGIVFFLSPNQAMLIPTFWLMGLMVIGILVPLLASVLFWLVFSWQASPKTPFSQHLLKWGSAIVLAGAVVYLATIYTKTLGLKTHNPSPDERNLYAYIASLPKDTVLAGDPDIMEGIPLFSKRSVLFRSLFPDPNAPFIQYFDAQYAATPQPMLEFCQQYDVGYLVLNMQDFVPDYLAKEQFFYQPWNDEIVKLVTHRSTFIMPQVPAVFASGPYRVIKCDADTLLAGASSK